MNTKRPRTTRRLTAKLDPRPAEQGLTHALSFSTAEGLALYEGLILLDVFMSRPKYESTARPYGQDLVEQLRERIVSSAPELRTYAGAATASAQVRAPER